VAPDLLLSRRGSTRSREIRWRGFTLEPADVAHWTEAFRGRVAPTPVVGVLEGGYRLDLLAAGARAQCARLPEGRGVPILQS